MDGYLFAGYQILEFSKARRSVLKDIAHRLIPHEEDILSNWIRLQFSAWQPPGFSRKTLRKLYGDLLHNILLRMKNGQLEECIEDLEQFGLKLVEQNFPYEALIMSLHFLEESYLDILIQREQENTIEILVGVDEFLHAALASIANSYFRAYRRDLLEEAEVGRIVQESLLPEIPARVMDLDVGYTYLPAMNKGQVGGDLIDMFSIGDDSVAFIVGDLSGHGLEAAVESVMIRSLFKGFMLEEENVLAAVSRLNRVLCKQMKSGSFVTVIAGMYNWGGLVELVGAGHPPAILCNGSCGFLEPGGLALGIDAQTRYESVSIRLEKDATLVIYTDGLEEARIRDELFGEKRIMQALKAVRSAPARVIADHIRDEALRFAGGRIHDDMAIMVMKRRFHKSANVAQ